MKTFIAFVAIFAVAFAGECDRMCTDEWNPVCASNGQTYSNQCDFEVALCENGFNIELMGEGECSTECQLSCPFNVHEICGSNGLTFNNECLMDIANCVARQFNKPPIAVSFDGKCVDSPCGGIMCTMDYSPVCGSNGFTFSNPCVMEKVSCFLEHAELPPLAKAFDGECSNSDCADMMCTMEYNPVCASNGLSFSNPCAMSVASCYLEHAELPALTVSHEGECVFEDGDDGDDEEGNNGDCDRMCTQDWNPVCASNGQTYSNQCEFEVALCQNGFSMELMGEGECSTECQLACPKNLHEICGSNGFTFANECLMNVANCVARQFNKPPIAMSFDGKCIDSPCGGIMCTMDYSPVCGSNGFTFSNACAMETASCFLENAGLPALAQAFDGECSNSECANMMCTMEYNPVCASNGLSFSNPCAMAVASCYLEHAELPALTVSHDGVCVFEDDNDDEGNNDGWNPVPWSEIIPFDHNQDGTITWSEFVDASHNFNPNSNHLVDIFAALDLDHNNHITEEEYNTAMEQGANIVGFNDTYQPPPQTYNFFTTTAGIVVLVLSSLAVVIMLISVAYMCFYKQAVTASGDFVELGDEDDDHSAEMKEVKSEKI